MQPHVTLVVLAGGSGTRTNHPDNKVFRPIGGRPVLSFPVETAAFSRMVDHLMIVTRPEDRAVAGEIVGHYAADLSCSFVEGGPTRHQSEWNAINELADQIEHNTIDLVAIHDGARPFLSIDLLRTLIERAAACGGALPGTPFEGVVARGTNLVDSDRLQTVQTPQVFAALPLLEAYRAAEANGFEGADTAETVARYTDTLVVTVEGDLRNIKVTFPGDFQAADRYVAEWREGRWLAPQE